MNVSKLAAAQAHFRLQLPVPTAENPLIQLDFLFHHVATVKSTGKDALLEALSFYKRVYLPATNNWDPQLATKKLFLISEQWDSFALVKVQNFLKTSDCTTNQGVLYYGSGINITSALRKVMRYAAENNLTRVQKLVSISAGPI